MSTRKEIAIKLFDEKYNCSQAIFLAYSDLFNIDRATALKLTSGFGGGIAGLGETCGAVNSAVMLLGLKYGITDIADVERKKEIKEVIRNFVNEFNQKHKAIYCRNLLTEDEGMTHKMHSDKCSSIVEEICELLEKYL